MDVIIMIKYIALLGGVILLSIPLISNYSSTSTSNLPQISRSHKHGTILFFKELFNEDQKNQLRELRSALFGVSDIQFFINSFLKILLCDFKLSKIKIKMENMLKNE